MIGLLFLALSVAAPFSVGLSHGNEYAIVFTLGNFLIASSFLFSAHNAYKFNRLVEPATFFVLIQYICYGPANWLPVAGADMYISNPGSLEFYPMAAVFAGMGMWMYILIYNAIRHRYDPIKQMSFSQIGYSNLLALNVGCIIVYFVLSMELGQFYGFEGAGKGLTGPINWIALALPVVIFAVIVSVSFYWNKNWRFWRKLLLSFAVLCNITVTASFVSRTKLLLVVGTFCMVFLQRELIADRISRANNKWKNMHLNAYSAPLSYALTNKISKIALVTTIALIVLSITYVAGTYIKTSGIASNKLSGVERLEAMAIKEVNRETVWENMGIDISYRMACLELPAAILASQYNGRDWLWGESFVLGLKGALPNFLSTGLGLYQDKIREKEEVESNMIYHFSLVETDQTGSVLASAVADFGPLGVFIFFPLLALFHGQFLLRLYLNPVTAIAYFGTLPYVMLFDHYVDAQFFELLKFLGFLFFIFLPFTIWHNKKARKPRLRTDLGKVLATSKF